MTRLQQILSVTLAGQLILAVILFWPRGTTEAGAPLLPGLDPAEVATVIVEDTNFNRVDLARDGGGWILTSGGDYPANSETVESLLEKIVAIDTSRLATRTDESHDRLQVADDNYVVRVRLGFSDDSTRTLYVGSSPNPRSTHVRLAGQSETFVTGELSRSDLQTTAGGWIDTTYITLNRDDIIALTVENDQGTFELEKVGEEEWTLLGLSEDEPFDDTQLNTMLSRISNMRLSEPLGTELEEGYGLADPQATVTVTTEDAEGNGESYTLRIGAFDSGANIYTVKWSDSDYYVTVSAFNAEPFVEATRDGFIAEPEPAEGTDAG